MDLLNDRYELLEVISSGGMATVWRARDIRLGRDVAVKKPHPSPPGSGLEARMRREARVAAGLAHPNLVTVYDYGEENESPYLVMELVEGPTLRERMGEIGRAEAADIGSRIADGLAAIHGAGIVHRDVKPANIIMSVHGPLLTDFGIAIDLGAADDITEPGKVVATPGYAPPEVLGGAPPTPASDVYSLALVVREMFDASGEGIDDRLESALAPALSDVPDDRPSASELAEILRGESPTVVGVAAGGSTLVMEATSVAATPVPSSEGTPRVAGEATAPIWRTLSIAAVLGVALLAWIVAQASDEDGAQASPGADTTVPGSTAVESPSTTTTQMTSTTGQSSEDSVMTARERLEALLLEPPRDDFKPKEVDGLMKKVDQAIAIAESDPKRAAKELEKVVDMFDRLDDSRRSEAEALVEELAATLGLEHDGGNDEGD
ncbi:MAG: serine/threonine-protein kinase [Acidimicrobiia bacterium]